MPEKVIVAEPRYFNHINDFLSESEFEEFKSWMIIKFINKKVQPTYLKDFREAAFHSDKQFMVFRVTISR